MLAHDYNLGLGQLLPDKTRCFQTALAWHAYVEKDEIGEEFSRFPKRL